MLQGGCCRGAAARGRRQPRLAGDQRPGGVQELAQQVCAPPALRPVQPFWVRPTEAVT